MVQYSKLSRVMGAIDNLKNVTRLMIFSTLLSVIIFTGCNVNKETRLEQNCFKVLSNFAFCDWNATMDIVIEIEEFNSDVPNGGRAMLIITGHSKEELVADSWISESTVCNTCELNGKLDTVIQKYGNSGVQIKIQGNRIKKIFFLKFVN